MRPLARLLRSAGPVPSVTFSESSGDVCTRACLATARLERDRTAALRNVPPR
jgi:hypothetical protein